MPEAQAAVVPPERRAARRRAALTLLAALLILALVISAIGPADVAATLRDVRWMLVLAAAGVLICTTLLGAFNAWQLGALGAEVPFPRFVAVFWSGWAVGLVVPGQVADVLWSTGMLRRLGMSGTTVLARLGVDKLLSLVIVLLAVATLPVATGEPRLWPLAVAAVVTALALLFATPVASSLAGYIGGRNGTSRWRVTIATVIERAAERFRHSRGRVLLNLGLSVAKLTLMGLSYWLVFRALGIDPPPLWRVAVVAAAAGLVAYLPISLNGIGTVEIAGVLLFGMLGIAAPVVASAYLLLRALTLLVAWVPVGILAPLAANRER